MPFRPKLFLTFSVLCVLPLLVLSLLNLRSGLQITETLLRDDLEDELTTAGNHYQSLMLRHRQELVRLAKGPLNDYVRRARTPEAVALIDPLSSATSGAANEAADTVRQALERLNFRGFYFAAVACFDSERRFMFMAEPNRQDTITVLTKDFIPGRIEADPRVWQGVEDVPICTVVTSPVIGEVERCSIPIFLTGAHDANSFRAAVVADIKLDRLFSEAMQGRDLSDTQARSPARLSIVLNSFGTIIYHPNKALTYQPVDSAVPGFASVARSMKADTQRGSAAFGSAAGDEWLAAYAPLGGGLSLAVARNYTLATQGQRRAGWLGIALSFIFGIGAALLFTVYFQKKTLRIERLTETVASIAGGNLDRRVETPSSDDLRPIADSVNVMSERLREQIAREAEEHQFQSFIKLSALLTHDLKNAIEALSLTVSNMERHFDNAEFRIDAMKGLTSATDKLRALVTRLSNPVNTLSGEFKMPQPTDLVPLLRRALAQNAEPLSGIHEIDVRLPSSLFALADAERVEKVMENLIINAIEAMSGNNGKLTVAAGAAETGRVFFSVTDTGVGMSPVFIQQRLFRPFATTKTRGVGLGLYTCREVIRASGGTIEVDSTQGSGTSFRVVLASADNARMKAEG